MRKAQVWYMDYMLASFVFILALLMYFEVTSNLSREEEGNLYEMTLDAGTISTSLLTEGYPANWNSSSVQRMGLISDGRLDIKKYVFLSNMKYSNTTYIFGTIYDYYMFFENREGETIYLADMCGFGKAEFNSTTNSIDRYAYMARSYGQRALADEIANYTLYDETNITLLLNRIRDYNLVIMEDPELSTSYIVNLTSYVLRGGKLMVSGRLFDNETTRAFSTVFINQSNCSNATMIKQHQFINMSSGDSMSLAGCAGIQGDFTSYANRSNDTSGLAIISYGSGEVYYWSSFNGTVGIEPVSLKAAQFSRYHLKGTCTSINPLSVDTDNLVTTNRFVVIDNEIVKMVMYLWD